jgi:Raf kinase inhibitor-like YbhB/YbcL family protein
MKRAMKPRGGVALALVVCAACKSSGGQPSAPPGISVVKLAVTSASFASNGTIPVDYTCDGLDKSPQLTWSAPPEGTRAFAIVLDDPDAPGGTFTHWIAFDIRPDVLGLPENADPAAFGGDTGMNDFKRTGYAGPCPPKLEIHHYVFHMFALNAPLGVAAAASRSALDAALSGHVLAEGALVGTFSR